MKLDETRERILNSQFIAITIQRTLAEEENWQMSKMRLIDRMAKAKDRGTNGVIAWTRDEIQERWSEEAG